MRPTLLITAALPYANGPLHFGHIAGAYLPADVHARFRRLCGEDVLYLCGSDEHGIAITLSAEQAGRSPQEHVDHYHALIQETLASLDITFDHYSRTTSPSHAQNAQAFFLDLLEAGHIESRVTDQLYSEEEGRFLADRYVVGECPRCGATDARGDECLSCGATYEAIELRHPRSLLRGTPLIPRPTRHWFLLLDHFREPLLTWLNTKQWKSNVTAFAENYIQEIKPRAITRDSEWGVPVPLPEAEGKVLYVWFDAPIGYITATKEWAEKEGDPEAWKRYWFDPSSERIQFIGKDNIPFHAAIFPAMIMGQKEPYLPVDHLSANEFYLLKGQQFSKSSGHTIDLSSCCSQFSADQIRYVMAATAPENQDSSFSWEQFSLLCNGDLVGKYGNLVNRTLLFLQNKCGGRVPPAHGDRPEDRHFLDTIEEKVHLGHAAYSSYSLRRASHVIMEIASVCNGYFDSQAPWKGVKDPALREKMERTLYRVLTALHRLALLSLPLIPTSAKTLWEMLGNEDRLDQLTWEAALTRQPIVGRMLPNPERLFSPVDELG
ncbi:MAG: methionine--tRNA ligase [Chlamydiota bacterium]|nr:methionine--tRNA ligase [Chlamydiota bacterium]